VAAIVFWLWYRIVKMIDNAVYRSEAGESNQALPLPASEQRATTPGSGRG
jgi:hypothetical protein